MNVNEMRNYISDRYPGIGWKRKVKYMPDNQVIAIYHSILKRDKKIEEIKRLDEVEHQMTIWELFN